MTHHQTTIDVRKGKLPDGSRAIVLANGTLLNPSLASLKSVVRAGPADFELIVQWLTNERAREAERVRANEEHVQRIKEKEPWRF